MEVSNSSLYTALFLPTYPNALNIFFKLTLNLREHKSHFLCFQEIFEQEVKQEFDSSEQDQLQQWGTPGVGLISQSKINTIFACRCLQVSWCLCDIIVRGGLVNIANRVQQATLLNTCRCSIHLSKYMYNHLVPFETVQDTHTDVISGRLTESLWAVLTLVMRKHGGQEGHPVIFA